MCCDTRHELAASFMILFHKCKVMKRIYHENCEHWKPRKCGHYIVLEMGSDEVMRTLANAKGLAGVFEVCFSPDCSEPVF